MAYSIPYYTIFEETGTFSCSLLLSNSFFVLYDKFYSSFIRQEITSFRLSQDSYHTYTPYSLQILYTTHEGIMRQMPSFLMMLLTHRELPVTGVPISKITFQCFKMFNVSFWCW